MSRSSPRSTWADVAKGACIVLVVLWHVVAKHYLRISWEPHTVAPGAWGRLGEGLLPLRMPVFFTVSGLFAVSAVRASWSVVLRGRVFRYGYFYVVWVLIDTVLLSATPDFPTERAETVGGLLAELLVSPTNLWYLLALALYFVVARTARSVRLPPTVLLLGALVLSVAASAELLPHADVVLWGNRIDVLQNLVFFLAGLHLGPFIEQLAERATRRRLLISGAVFATAVVAVTATDSLAVVGVWPACAGLATIFSVTAASLVSRHPRVAEPVASIGQRTLPIYVLHLPLLAGLDALLTGPLGQLPGAASVPLQVVEPLVLTTVIVGLCLLLHRGLIALGATRLFVAPLDGATRTPTPARRAAGRGSAGSSRGPGR